MKRPTVDLEIRPNVAPGHIQSCTRKGFLFLNSRLAAMNVEPEGVSGIHCLHATLGKRNLLSIINAAKKCGVSITTYYYESGEKK